MGSLTTRTAAAYHNHVFHQNFPNLTTSIQSPPSIFFFSSSSINHSRPSPTHLHRPFRGPFLILTPTSLRCQAGTPGPPPGIEPHHKGITTTISKVWDTVRIYFAVLFWMSLFFWASAKNIDGRNKGNRFRK